MNKKIYPRLVLPEDYNDLDWAQITEKGWMEAKVELDSNSEYKLNIYDPIRLKQDIDYQLNRGEPYFELPNLVVLPEITRNAVEASIQTLWVRGSFKFYKPE